MDEGARAFEWPYHGTIRWCPGSRMEIYVVRGDWVNAGGFGGATGCSSLYDAGKLTSFFLLEYAFFSSGRQPEQWAGEGKKRKKRKGEAVQCGVWHHPVRAVRWHWHWQ